jgi:hypothetical protein
MKTNMKAIIFLVGLSLASPAALAQQIGGDVEARVFSKVVKSLDDCAKILRDLRKEAIATGHPDAAKILNVSNLKLHISKMSDEDGNVSVISSADLTPDKWDCHIWPEDVSQAAAIAKDRSGDLGKIKPVIDIDTVYKRFFKKSDFLSKFVEHLSAEFGKINVDDVNDRYSVTVDFRFFEGELMLYSSFSKLYNNKFMYRWRWGKQGEEALVQDETFIEVDVSKSTN